MIISIVGIIIPHLTKYKKEKQNKNALLYFKKVVTDRFARGFRNNGLTRFRSGDEIRFSHSSHRCASSAFLRHDRRLSRKRCRKAFRAARSCGRGRDGERKWVISRQSCSSISAADMDIDSTKVYGEMLKKVLVYDNCMVDIYLNCMPSGFRIKFHVNKFNQQHRFNVFIDSCEAMPS